MTTPTTNKEKFITSLLQINRIQATDIFKQVYNNGKSFAATEDLVIDALESIGQGWENGQISLSQVYMSGVICEELIDKYFPITEEQKSTQPKIAIAVLLDHHALGKRIVYSVLRSGGFEIMDFGQGLSVNEIAEQTIKNQIEILLISTLRLTSALKVKDLKKIFSEKEYPVKIIVGGAPFRMDSNLWQEVGADADGKNASSLINTLQQLKGEA